MKQHKFLAVIPARAGSQQVKNKNIKNFCGYPLFIWSIAAALQSKFIDTIAVSSNYNNLEDMYLKYCNSNKKIRWIKRPEYLCGPESTTESCLIHTIGSLQDQNFDFVITLQPTSPLRLKHMIDQSISDVINKNKKSLFSVQSHTPFFVQKIGETLKWHYDFQHRKMRQNLTEDEWFFHDDGSLYISDVNTLLNSGSRLDSSSLLFVNDELCSRQIDTQTDFFVLTKIMQAMKYNNMYVQV